MPRANSPSVRGSSQPQSDACEMAISGATSPTASTAAPRRSTLPGVRTGDSGMSTWASTAARTAGTAPSQKIQW